MGRDKALIELDGRALVLHAVAALAEAGASEVFVVGRETGRLLGVTAIPDRFPDEGPLGGVISALAHACESVVALMPCDLTGATGLSVTSVIAALGTAEVAVPVVGGRRQWVQAAFRTSALESLSQRFESGARSIHAGVAGLALVEFDDGRANRYRDANRPSDLPEG